MMAVNGIYENGVAKAGQKGAVTKNDQSNCNVFG